jgi:hypothetical protein
MPLFFIKNLYRVKDTISSFAGPNFIPRRLFLQNCACSLRQPEILLHKSRCRNEK